MFLYGFGIAMMAIGTLRVMDCHWPTPLFPWQFYAAEVLIGFFLAIANIPGVS